MAQEFDLTQYTGLWVAICNEEIVASAQTPDDLINVLEDLKVPLENVSFLLVPLSDETHHIL